MAKFKKGQSGNPGGRPKLSPEIRRIRALTSDELKVMGDAILLGTRAKLQAILDDPESPPLECWIAQVALKGIQSGDMSSLNELLNRLIGKVTDRIEHDFPRACVIEKLDGGEIVLAAEVKEGE